MVTREYKEEEQGEVDCFHIAKLNEILVELSVIEDMCRHILGQEIRVVHLVAEPDEGGIGQLKGQNLRTAGRSGLPLHPS